MSGFFPDDSVTSWGRTLRAHHRVARPVFSDELDALLDSATSEPNGMLAIGLRRSYGDSGLNANGALIDTTGIDRLVSFDAKTGILHAEAGLSLAQLIDFSIPRGYFVPVTPGTKYVTLAGAVANDVHGKNHTRSGTFGRWVRHIGLLRSDGSHLKLTPEDNTGLFAETIGGLGLTGIITDVAVQLRPILSSNMNVQTMAFNRVSGFFELTRESLDHFEHTVSWVDFHASERHLGRGIFTKANHSEAGPLVSKNKAGPTIPFDLPEFVLNRLSVRAFNIAYFHKNRMRAGTSTLPYNDFFYPLDALGDWNRIYGKRGMIQYQCVIPPAVAEAATSELIRQISRHGQASFLAVLKTFGPLQSPGLLSFPMQGTTLALDFPNRGRTTLELLDRLDRVVEESGGRLYPAKDCRIPKEIFINSFPQMNQFVRHIDPAFSSSFWRRVNA
jgi:L-gulonolactone oxidase